MSLKYIKIYTTNQIKNVMECLEEQNIHSSFNERFSIQNDLEPIDIKADDKRYESTLITDLANLQHFPHPKRKQYNLEQISELSDLIRRHPNSVSMIRKSLKIPSSSYWRLVKEWKLNNQMKTQSKRKSLNHTNLNDSEQIWVAKFLKPPTYSTNVPQI